jgi:hypothetical protein
MISVKESYELFTETLSYLDKNKLSENNEDLEYYIFEELSADAVSFLHEWTVDRLITAKIIPADIRTDILNLRIQILKQLEKTSSIQQYKTDSNWETIRNQAEYIKDKTKPRLKIYGIGGLGADKRVFDFLKLNYLFVPIEWIEPNENESLKDYSIRLSKVIDAKSDFALIGVSFGGLVAVEISKVLKPRLTILISSAETKNELRPIYRRVGKSGLLNKLPRKLFDPPRNIAKFIFGTDNKKLLNSILDDTDLKFAKWAVNELVNWDNLDQVENLVRIHGTKDKLIPWNSSEKAYLVKNGEHFMIVDRAVEISKIINEEIKNAPQHAV